MTFNLNSDGVFFTHISDRGEEETHFFKFVKQQKSKFLGFFVHDKK